MSCTYFLLSMAIWVCMVYTKHVQKVSFSLSVYEGSSACNEFIVRTNSDDFLQGRFFMSLFGAVGRSKKKKEKDYQNEKGNFLFFQP